MLPIRAVHTWLTPSTGTLGPRSAGTGLELPPQKEQPLKTAPTKSTDTTCLACEIQGEEHEVRANLIFCSQVLHQQSHQHLVDGHPVR